MGESLREWRRKTGVLTLVFASVFVVGAYRSYFIQDMWKLPSEGASLSWLTSSNGIIDWTTIAPLDPAMRVMGTEENIELMTAVLASRLTENLFSGKNFVSDVRTATLRSTSWRLPYWFIILPLAVVSAQLLLCKPRNATPPITSHIKPLP